MASCLVRFGRFAFFVLLGLQAYSLASYPAKYKENDGYYGLTALFLPAFVLRLYIMISNKHLQWLFVVWLLYVIGLVIFIGIIFGGPAPVEDRFKGTTKSSGDGNNLTSCIESRNITNATDSTTSPSPSTDLTFSTALNKTEFFGPNVLKMTLCLTPLLLLLLLSTGMDSIRYRELMWMLSLRIALDLFDGVEMLEVILEENELSHDVPRSYEEAIIAFVCLTFLLSPLQLMEIKLNVRRKLETSQGHNGLTYNNRFSASTVFFWGFGLDFSLDMARMPLFSLQKIVSLLLLASLRYVLSTVGVAAKINRYCGRTYPRTLTTGPYLSLTHKCNLGRKKNATYDTCNTRRQLTTLLFQCYRRRPLQLKVWRRALQSNLLVDHLLPATNATVIYSIQ